MAKSITFLPTEPISELLKQLETIGYNQSEALRAGIRLLHRKEFSTHVRPREKTKPNSEVMAEKMYKLEKMSDGELTEFLLKIGFLEPKQPVIATEPDGNYMINRIGRIEMNDMRCTEWVYFTPEGKQYSVSQATMWPEIVNKLKRFKPFMEAKV